MSANMINITVPWYNAPDWISKDHPEHSIDPRFSVTQSTVSLIRELSGGIIERTQRWSLFGSDSNEDNYVNSEPLITPVPLSGAGIPEA